MNWKTRRKKLDKRGFTFAEVLVCVAILAISAAIAVPNLAQLWQTMRINELDDTARDIFLTAQNELTDMKSSGKLVEFAADSSAIQTEEVTEDSVTKTLYYVTSDTAQDYLDKVTTLMSTLSGGYVIYLDPHSGDVTDVYYSQSELSHDTVKSLRDLLGGSDDKDVRAKQKIGYYGGLSVSSAKSGNSENENQTETLELVNSEDLFVKLVYPQLDGAFTNTDQILATITVTDEHSNTVTLTADGSSALDSTPAVCIYADVDTNDDYTLYVLLDSMTDGCSFTELFPTLVAGDNITVKATLSYEGKTLYKNATIGTTNSLFAAKYAEDITKDGVVHSQGLEFAYARQLQNLRYYCQNDISIVQTADIDFDIGVRQQTMLPVQSHLDAAPEYFTPINLNSATSQNGITINGVDGKGTQHTLSNFKIYVAQSSSQSAGLIGNCTVSANLLNLRMADSHITGGTQTGTLIGKIQSTNGDIDIENCGVYQTSAGNGSVAGGLGAASGAERPTGGLIGAIQAENGAITLNSCFAAVDVTNGGCQTGGLVGKISGGSTTHKVIIENSYASGDVTSGSAGSYQSTAGGLIGITSGTVNISESFSSANVYASASAGALVGSNSGTLTATNSYSCGTLKVGSSVSYGPLVGNGSAAYSGCKYLSQSGNTGVTDGYGSSTPSGVTDCEYDDLALHSSGATIHNDSSKCHPYSASLQGKAYPFQMVTDEYYGDWPAKIEPAAKVAYGLCYYEKYMVGSTVSWGLYGYDTNGQLVSTLDNQNAKTIIDAGYCVVVPAGTQKVYGPNKGWGANATLGTKINIAVLNVDLYPLPYATTELMTNSNQLTRSVKDNQTGRWFYINPLFAAALSLTVLTADADQPMQIRTETQLRARSNINDSNWYFQQTHNIFVTQSDTGNFQNNTGCTYDGNGNTISGLHISLFNKNLGTVLDLSLSNFSISASGNEAALVLTNQGTLTNCHILNGSITGSGGYTAGLVANGNGGTITDCSVGTSGSNVSVTGSGQNTAGLIGYSNNVTITDCSVGTSGSSVTVTGSGQYTAGLAGYTSGGTITGCSVGLSGSSVTVTGSGQYTAGLVGVNGSGNTVTDCMVLNCNTSSSGGSSAGLVCYNNGGTISFCCSTSRVSAASTIGNASGFIDNLDGGSVSFCYANGTVIATVGSGTATGFCRIINQGSISNCFAIGTVSVKGGMATGFVKEVSRWNGSVSDCYTAVKVTTTGTGTCNGFTGSGYVVNCTDCYWVRQSGFNDTVSVPADSSGRVTHISFSQLQNLKTLANNWSWDSGDQSWTLTTTAAQTHPNSGTLSGQAYPYPRIVRLDFYGDWLDTNGN